MSKRILVFIPTYNEKKNVGRLLKLILSQKGPNLDVLFLDDNSPDGTGEVIDNLAQRNKNVFTIHRKGKLGIGSAHKRGIKWAYDHKYQILITMDSDMTHSPSYIPKLIEKSLDVDLVIASRYLSKRSMVGWNYFRTVMSKFSHLISKVLLGLNYDVSNAYRLYNLNQINPKVFDLVQSDSYSFFFESSYIIKQNGYRIVEIPATLFSRKYGSSKMRMKDIYLHFRNLGLLIFRNMFKPAEIKLNV
jgi:dolichol-phosphate mannosyltransferase